MMQRCSKMYTLKSDSALSSHGTLLIKIKFFMIGPVPVFFSEKPEATLENLKKSPEWAFHCLQVLVSRLLVRGQLMR